MFAMYSDQDQPELLIQLCIVYHVENESVDLN